MIKFVCRAAFAFLIAGMLIPHGPGLADRLHAIMKLAAHAAKVMLEKA